MRVAEFKQRAKALGWEEDRYGNLKKDKNTRLHFTQKMIRLEERKPRHKYTDKIYWVRVSSATKKQADLTDSGELLNFKE